MERRRFLGYGISSVALLTFGCSQVQKASALIDDATLVVDTFKKVTSLLPAGAGQVLSKMQDYVGRITVAAGQLVDTVQANVNQPIIQQIVNDSLGAVNAVLGSSIKVPPLVTALLQTVSKFLPALQAAVGIVAAFAAPVPGAMSPDEAREQLKRLLAV